LIPPKKVCAMFSSVAVALYAVEHFMISILNAHYYGLASLHRLKWTRTRKSL